MSKKFFLIAAALFLVLAVANAEETADSVTEETTSDGKTPSGGIISTDGSIIPSGITTPESMLGIGGESVFDLSSPFALTYASSVIGGGIFSANPTSLIVNPALAAREQRVGLNLGYTALIGTGDESSFGSAFQLGIMIPFRWGVLSGLVNGTFPNNPGPFGFGNSINAKAGVSKEISEHLIVGAGLNGGGTWGNVGDWALSANLGFVYTVPNLGFMKDFRYGVSILNLGKNYATVSDGNFLDHYPSFATIKVGAAGLLFSNDIMKLGASLDLTSLCFRNMLFDMGLQFMLKDMITVSVAEKINLMESINGVNNYIPSVGIFFNFKFNVKGNEYLASRDWSENEMTVGAAYKNLYSDVQAVSAGADLLLGMVDKNPPVIVIWPEEDEE